MNLKTILYVLFVNLIFCPHLYSSETTAQTERKREVMSALHKCSNLVQNSRIPESMSPLYVGPDAHANELECDIMQQILASSEIPDVNITEFLTHLH